MAASNMAAWRRDNSIPTLVEITLVNGSHFRATLLIQREKTLHETISVPDPFLEIESAEQGTIILARSCIQSVRPYRVAKADQLSAKALAAQGFDAHAVLGVAKDCGMEEISDAYQRRLEIYHPERFAAAGLPPEVIQYLEAMTQRIEEAYVVLTAPRAEPQVVKV